MESVWDYPVRPLVEPVSETVRVVFAGETVAATTRALRVLERSHPPVYYVPRDDVREDALRPVTRKTFCEWKGHASYFDLVVGERVSERAAWTYPAPTPEYPELRDAVAFYCGRVDEAWVGDERAEPEANPYYGGWITSGLRL